MKRVLALTTMVLLCSRSAIVADPLVLRSTALSGGQLQILATNIPSGIAGYCVWESSSNLVTWKPIATNLVYKTWSTNTFVTTNSMRFYRVWVY